MSQEQDKSIVECIRDFIKKCPYLPDYANTIGVDYLDGDISSYAIEAVPCKPIIKTYVSGQTIRQFTFYFCSRECCTRDVLENLEVSMFYEKFQDWLETCTRNEDLPVLTGGKAAQQIMATTHGYVFDANQDKAQYTIQCNLIYYCP